MISAIILASGFSRRMGENKLHLEINNKKIYQHVIDEVSKVSVSEKIIVTNDDEISNYGENLEFISYKNYNAFIGKSESIKIGIQKSNSNNDFIIFMCDQPFIKACIIEKIINEFNLSKKITYPLYGNKFGSPVIFPKEYRKKFLTLTGDEGGKKFINEFNSHPCHISDEFCGIDIDTHEEFNLYKKLKTNN